MSRKTSSARSKLTTWSTHRTLSSNFNIRGVGKFESEFTQRTDDADMDEFMEQ
jgi:hypothetical protein